METKARRGCEKCWGDAYLRYLCNPSKSQAEHYRELLDERKETPCSETEQLGQFATEELSHD